MPGSTSRRDRAGTPRTPRPAWQSDEMTMYRSLIFPAPRPGGRGRSAPARCSPTPRSVRQLARDAHSCPEVSHGRRVQLPRATRPARTGGPGAWASWTRSRRRRPRAPRWPRVRPRPDRRSSTSTKTKKKIGELKEELGGIVYAERTGAGNGSADAEIARLVGEISEAEASARDDRRRGRSGGALPSPTRPPPRPPTAPPPDRTVQGATCITAVTAGIFPRRPVKLPLHAGIGRAKGDTTMRSRRPRAAPRARDSGTLVVVTIAAVGLTASVRRRRAVRRQGRSQRDPEVRHRPPGRRDGQGSRPDQVALRRRLPPDEPGLRHAAPRAGRRHLQARPRAVVQGRGRQLRHARRCGRTSSSPTARRSMPTAVKFSIDRAVASKNTEPCARDQQRRVRRCHRPADREDHDEDADDRLLLRAPRRSRDDARVTHRGERRSHRVQHQARRCRSVHRHRVHAAVDHVAAEEPRLLGRQELEARRHRLHPRDRRRAADQRLQRWPGRHGGARLQPDRRPAGRRRRQGRSRGVRRELPLPRHVQEQAAVRQPQVPRSRADDHEPRRDQPGAAERCRPADVHDVAGAVDLLHQVARRTASPTT